MIIAQRFQSQRHTIGGYGEMHDMAHDTPDALYAPAPGLPDRLKSKLKAYAEEWNDRTQSIKFYNSHT